MRIGIASPFNPGFVSDHFDEQQELPSFHHAATSVNLYVRALLELGHDLVVFTICPQNVLAEGEAYRRIVGRHITVYIISPKMRNIPLRWLYVLPHRIVRLIRREIDSLDVLHAEWTYEYGVAVSRFSKRIPVFCSVRDWCPYQLQIQTDKQNRRYWSRKRLWFRIVMACREFVYLANSDYTQEQILKSYPEKRVVQIPNPVNSKRILLRRDSYPVTPVFVSICQNLEEERKNIKTLCAAFQKYLLRRPEAELVLVGRYSARWKESMEQEGLLRRVCLRGALPYESIFDVLDRATCLVHPSLEETFGNILLEAMCRRIPCIGGADAGAVRQILGDGQYGILCDVRSEDSLCATMEAIEDRGLFETIIDRCTERLSECYAEKLIAQKHVDLFAERMRAMEMEKREA